MYTPIIQLFVEPNKHSPCLDQVDSPIEALDARKAAGFERVIDIPFEFDSNSRDTLIVLRQGYEREIPDWNERFESTFTY